MSDNFYNLLSTKTFETTSALSAFYMWIAFNYLASLLNCDIQRFIATNPSSKHLVGLLTFFFLFTVLDPMNNAGVLVLFLKTLFVYIIFVALIKSKWYFVIPSLILLITDQTMKLHVNYLQKQERSDEADKWQNIRSTINIINISLIILGCLHYLIYQYLDKGPEFSIIKFLIPVKECSISK